MLDPRGLDGLLHVLVLGLGVGPRRPLLPLAADGRDEGGADIAHEVGGHGGGGGGRRHQQQLRAPGQSQLRQFWSSVIEQRDLGAIQALSKVSKFIDKQNLGMPFIRADIFCGVANRHCYAQKCEHNNIPHLALETGN